MTARLVVSAAAPLLLAAYAAFLLWRVAVEDGFVGTPPTPLQIALRSLANGIRVIHEAMGAQLLPTIRAATDAFRTYQETSERIHGTLAQVELVRGKAVAYGLDPERVLAAAHDIARAYPLTFTEACERVLARAARNGGVA